MKSLKKKYTKKWTEFEKALTVLWKVKGNGPT